MKKGVVGMSTSHVARRASTRQRPRTLAAALFVAVFLAGLALVVGTFVLRSGLPVDLDGNAVALGDGDVPDTGVVAEMNIDDNTGLRFTVPALAMDVPLGELSVVRSTLTPPGFVQAYRVRNLGVPLDRASAGTVYVVMHSVNKGFAPGNYLFDVPTARALVKPGDALSVGGVNYIVDGSQLIDKPDLPQAGRLWSDEPGRVVVITCLQRTQGRSLQNLIITGHLA